MGESQSAGDTQLHSLRVEADPLDAFSDRPALALLAFGWLITAESR
jgi:hypothetical protein